MGFETSHPGPVLRGWQSNNPMQDEDGATRIVMKHRDYTTTMGYVIFNSKLSYGLNFLPNMIMLWQVSPTESLDLMTNNHHNPVMTAVESWPPEQSNLFTGIRVSLCCR